MKRRKTAGAMLICAAFAMVAAAPMAQSSETDTVHTILKDENGPPSTCALTWEFTAPSDGTWSGHIVNYGMRWIILDMVCEDCTEVPIDRDMYRYAVYGNNFYSDPVAVTGGHKYSITGTPNGPLLTYVTVEDYFVPDVEPQPPVAAFTVSVDGLMVSVDASGSSDPDGVIVDYLWDWGDGSTGEGETTSHTYVPPESETTAVESGSPVLRGVPPNYYVWGFVKDSEDNPVAGAEVTVTVVRTGGSISMLSLANGVYQLDLANAPNELGEYYENEDEVLVEAVLGTLSGSEVVYVDTSSNQVQCDVTLEESGPAPFDVTITLTVVDDDGLTATVEQTVTLYP